VLDRAPEAAGAFDLSALGRDHGGHAHRMLDAIETAAATGQRSDARLIRFSSRA
jgi:hypothetical protein